MMPRHATSGRKIRRGGTLIRIVAGMTVVIVAINQPRYKLGGINNIVRDTDVSEEQRSYRKWNGNNSNNNSKKNNLLYTITKRNDEMEKGEPTSDIQKRQTAAIYRIALVGERNSGTNWMLSELQRCFPTTLIEPLLIRGKHWFQDNTIENGILKQSTLVIAQFRNPYEWVEAMRKKPHHASHHLRMNWLEFVTTPWTAPQRPQRDLDIPNKEDFVCFENFTYNEIISCVQGNFTDPEYLATYDPQTRLNLFGYNISNPHDWSAHEPIYELHRNGSGLPYSSILQLRADKIRNFVSIREWDWISDFLIVQYEDLIRNGTTTLMNQIERMIGTTKQCTPTEPQMNRTKRDLDPVFIAYLNRHVDWDAEGLIGYTNWPAPTLNEIQRWHKRKSVQRTKRPQEYWIQKHQPAFYEKLVQKREKENQLKEKMKVDENK